MSHPYPQKQRDNWKSLDGDWNFACADENVEKFNKIFNGVIINVPFSYETELSGVGDSRAHKYLYYQRQFTLDDDELTKCCYLCFEFVDYCAIVYVNGHCVGKHSGAYECFDFDITDVVIKGVNTIEVAVIDDANPNRPQGKQRLKKESYSCWYTQTSGIYGHVFLEFRSQTYLDSFKMTPNIAAKNLDVQIILNQFITDSDYSLKCVARYNGEIIREIVSPVISSQFSFVLNLFSIDDVYQVKYWELNNPSMYDMDLMLYEGDSVVDTVHTYFGFREFCAKDGCLTVNYAPVYSKLVLYQGYHALSGLTQPSLDSIREDLKLIKELGFNGLRVHQKIESEEFLTECDRAGLMVWCEMPSCYDYNEQAKIESFKTWMSILNQKYNHPCIAAWVAFNESWGINGVKENLSMQRFADSLYCYAKSADAYRPVITNDGWEHVSTDIVTVHNYEQNPQKLYNAYCNEKAVKNGRNHRGFQRAVFSDGYSYKGQPVVISEFGGIAFASMENGCWGYSTVSGAEELCKKIHSLIEVIEKLEYICGYCYTQFCDCEQERNGLTDGYHKPKFNPVILKQINHN